MNTKWHFLVSRKWLVKKWMKVYLSKVAQGYSLLHHFIIAYTHFCCILLHLLPLFTKSLLLTVGQNRHISRAEMSRYPTDGRPRLKTNVPHSPGTEGKRSQAVECPLMSDSTRANRHHHRTLSTCHLGGDGRGGGRLSPPARPESGWVRVSPGGTMRHLLVRCSGQDSDWDGTRWRWLGLATFGVVTAAPQVALARCTKPEYYFESDRWST